MGNARRGEHLPLPRFRRRKRAGVRVDRVREGHPFRDPCRDPDRPVGAGRDDAVDVPSPGQPVDRLLVLRGEHRALVGESEAGRLRVPVDRDHLQVAARPGGL
jgi:hypothetical protein